MVGGVRLFGSGLPRVFSRWYRVLLHTFVILADASEVRGRSKGPCGHEIVERSALIVVAPGASALPRRTHGGETCDSRIQSKRRFFACGNVFDWALHPLAREGFGGPLQGPVRKVQPAGWPHAGWCRLPPVAVRGFSLSDLVWQSRAVPHVRRVHGHLRNPCGGRLRSGSYFKVIFVGLSQS